MKHIKISRYKIALLFNAFPSYSISVWFSSIFVQPRLFSLPFLLPKKLYIRYNKWNNLLILNILISAIVPLVGFFFDRQFYLLDIAYFLSFIYALLFINALYKKIVLFNKFIKIILILNFLYIFLQIFFYYTGFPELTMLHSNIPFHVKSGYQVSSGILGLPRYTGLFVESGPLVFFLCLTCPYIMQKGKTFSCFIKAMTLILIILSQSKFLLLFLPIFVAETILKKILPGLYRKLLSPLTAASVLLLLLIAVCLFLYSNSELSQYLSNNIPAYDLRLNGIKNTINGILDIGFFGNGLLPSNIDLPDSKFQLASLDAISIVISGYGLVFGIIVLSTFFLFPVLARFEFKYAFIAAIIMGMLSSGSLIVPQYLFALIYPVIGQHQYKRECQQALIRRSKKGY
jgi:hypothetical protein